MNIFCILGKTGSGKTTFLNDIINDKKFMNNNKLELLVYGTTRNKRENEVDEVDYHFHTQEEYDRIEDDELIESRSYYTINDGIVYYFTKTDYFNSDKNIICVVSPYQYENYRSWCAKENIGADGTKKDCLTSLSNSLPLCCGGWDRTTDLQVMSLTSCHCSTPRYKYLRPRLFATLLIISALST